MKFRVTRQYQRGPESELAKFTDEVDAKRFACDKSSSDGALKVNTVYRLYQGSVLLETFDSSDLEQSAESNENSVGGKDSGQSFSPNPFQTAPRPSGMSNNWIKDKKFSDEKDSDEGKK